MCRPQRPQNRELCGSGAEHLGHGYVEADSPGLIMVKEPLPHRPQKRTPSANREWQFEQATMPGIKLETGEPPLLPCEDEGWLPCP